MDKQLTNKAYTILELFIQEPNKEFSARAIARTKNLSHATVLKHLREIKKIGLIQKKETTLYPVFKANQQEEKYLFYKKNWLVFKLLETKTIEHIQQTTLPSTIILFGSGAKGTYNKKSDIDLFIQAKETTINLEQYEKKIGYKINLLFEQDINNLSSELKNNILNGTILYGFVKITE